jgi:class 3 adenylate cyclase
VNKAARATAMAHGGQILVTCAIYKAVKKEGAVNLQSVEFVSMGKVDFGGQKGVSFFPIID